MDIHSLAQLPSWFTWPIVFLLGLAVGSFVNVVIYRVPRQMSIVTPPSHCPGCSTPLKAQDLVPLISFLWLGAKCRSCGERISIRYPVVELMVGILFLIVWRADGMSWPLLLDWAFVSAMIALAMIDLEHRLLPDRITYPGFVLAVGTSGLLPQAAVWPWLDISGRPARLVGAGLIAASGFIMLAIEWLDYQYVGRRIEDIEAAQENEPSAHTHMPMAAGEAPTSTQPTSGLTPSPPSPEEGAPGSHYLGLATVVGGLVLAVIYWLAIPYEPEGEGGALNPHVSSVIGSVAGAALGAGMIWGLRIVYFVLRNIEGVGFGDVKMMMMVGAYLGWSQAFLTLLLASVLGSVVGIALMIRSRDRHIGLPYGLFIAVAAIVALLAGKPLVGWYSGHYPL